MNKNHGCLYYLIGFPIILPFYFIKWIFSLSGNIIIWLLMFAIIAAIAGVSLYILIPVGIIFLIYSIFKSNKYKNLPDFDNMTGIEFENFCSYLLSKNGFEDVKTTKASGDQGIDILARNGHLRYGIQCKCYSSNIGNSAVQEAFSGIKYYGCDRGIVITNQYFTKSAIDLSQSTGIFLWDRNKLFDLINHAYKTTEIRHAENVDIDNVETVESLNKKNIRRIGTFRKHICRRHKKFSLFRCQTY